MSELCSIAECGRRVSAADLCATHRRRKRLRLPMEAPIRMKEITVADLVAAAVEVDEAEAGRDHDGEFDRRVRRFRRLVRRWATCP